jgi:hypothetical protein
MKDQNNILSRYKNHDDDDDDDDDSKVYHPITSALKSRKQRNESNKHKT